MPGKFSIVSCKLKQFTSAAQCYLLQAQTIFDFVPLRAIYEAGQACSIATSESYAQTLNQ